MHSGAIIPLSIISGLLLLFAILGLMFSQVRKKLDTLIATKFASEEILGATTKANFFGIKSKGGAQIRGNGAFVLTKDDICFIRAVPLKEYTIPTAAIRSVSMPRFFNGKSVLVPLLCITYCTEYGEDSVAWALPHPEKWKDAIEKMLR